MSRASTGARSPVRDAAPLFAALGDETRLQLVMRLAAGGPGSITRLSANSKVTRQAISKHLAILSQAGLVRSTRRGRERVWDLAPERLSDAHEYLDRISRMWDKAIDRLRAFVESDED
ncbi:MAG TPA: metalloregulator ArsR/SmtB family transcription factor [Gemmatimonadaceae bacterium]|nr:metalloregulator ArsR/SmtB family transcription factor [Gemmatimonadaceae bacterium]